MYTWAQFITEVKNRLTQFEVSDDTAVRAVADFVKAKAARDLLGDKAQHDSLWQSYMIQRSALIGHTITLSDSALKARVRELITDISITEDAAIRAVADFVKSRVSREVDHDETAYAIYDASWKTGRNRLLGYAMTTASGPLRTAVNTLITVDANRVGLSTTIDAWIAQAKEEIGGLATFLDKYIDQAKRDIAGSATRILAYIRQGAIELQEHVEFYRIGHTQTYAPADVTNVEEACTIALPECTEILDGYIVSDTDETVRGPLTAYPWDNRHDLVVGTPLFKCGGGWLIAINPYLTASAGHEATVFPPVLDGFHIDLFYTALKLNFADPDITPFDEEFINATAAYVIWKWKADTESRQTYLESRLALYRKSRARTGIKRNAGSPQPAGCYSFCGVTASGSTPAPSSSAPGLYWGEGPPEGVQAANPGSKYWDHTNHAEYVKDSGSGNTGWIQTVSGS